jgi:hypothetical protein
MKKGGLAAARSQKACTEMLVTSDSNVLTRASLAIAEKVVELGVEQVGALVPQSDTASSRIRSRR